MSQNKKDNLIIFPGAKNPKPHNVKGSGQSKSSSATKVAEVVATPHPTAPQKKARHF